MESVFGELADEFSTLLGNLDGTVVGGIEELGFDVEDRLGRIVRAGRGGVVVRILGEGRIVGKVLGGELG